MKLNASNAIRKAVYDLLVYNFSNTIQVLSFDVSHEVNTQKYVAITTIDELDSSVKCKDRLFSTYNVSIVCVYKYLQRAASYIELENIVQTVIFSLANIKLDVQPDFLCVENKYVSGNHDIIEDGKGVVVKKTLLFRINVMQV